MTRKFSLFLVVLFSAAANSQIRPDVQEILAEFGNVARAYFLSANRPSYGVDAYTLPKGMTALSFFVSGNNEVLDVPFSFSFGIAHNTEVFTGVSVYTRSYNFAGERISGLGDANLGMKYKFQESDLFSHAVQFIVKLPTASSKNQLGTGRIDFHFGAAQGFFYRSWGYDLSIELNFLHRRDYPTGMKRMPIEFQESLDSIKEAYDYKYETEFVISAGPSVELSDKFGMYAGFSFSRNLKLKYNLSDVYAGIGYSPTEKFDIGLGTSFGILNTFSWLLSAGIGYEF